MIEYNLKQEIEQLKRKIKCLEDEFSELEQYIANGANVPNNDIVAMQVELDSLKSQLTEKLRLYKLQKNNTRKRKR